jgi:glucosamine-6-phosphate isomerase
VQKEISLKQQQTITMKIIIANNYEDMSRQAAHDVIETMQLSDQPLFCPASGDTPVGLYKELIHLHQQQKFDSSNWSFVGLDEWVGMNETDEGSCKYSLNAQLFYPLKVADDKIYFFDGRAKDLNSECDRIEQFIQRHGGIDVAVLGLGMNGHVGMNEPYTSPSLRSHIATLDPVTQQVGQKYFKERRRLSQGITLGLATLLDSKHIFLLVSGKRKAAIVKKVIEGDIIDEVPASLLRRHSDLKIYLDVDAAEVIQS